MRLQRHHDGTRSIISMIWRNTQRRQRTRMCWCSDGGRRRRRHQHRHSIFSWQLLAIAVALRSCIAAAVVVSGGGLPPSAASMTHDNFMPSAEASSSILAMAGSTADELAGSADAAEVAGVTDAIEGTNNDYAGNNKVLSSNENNNSNNIGGNTREDNVAPPATYITPLHKEVVEQLIKQWAPIVWLAPEEQFLPLGVDEFLNHVHATGDKGKTLMPGMPIGDSSTKAFLVTNTEIDDLLKDENSFIYGRNPNETPVPIYAVVTLCNTRPAMSASYDRVAMGSVTDAPKPPVAPSSLRLTPATNVVHSTRGPYIPVSIDPLDERNNTLRRSSRLYPVFQRMRRSAIPSENIVYTPLVPQHQFQTTSNLAIGETSRVVVPVTTETPDTAGGEGSTDAQVNNFIANLADNVKFSGQSSGNALDNGLQYNGGYNRAAEGIFDDRPHRKQNQKVPPFHVTYWMFYPYSQGKSVCTLSLGPLGRIPFPAVYGYCLGKRKDIGSHIGDWEHMSLYFNGGTEPEAMYVSAHDAGAYYSYNQLTGSFEFKKQETRKGILQRPNFPKTVTTFNSHPVLFAAKGSHGLWTAPGKHRFVKVARLYDINGFGTPWNTWKFVDITYKNLKSYGRSLLPPWLSFKGKWGNPKSRCHPFRRIGLNFCEFTDGPTGIPLKEPHFQCGATYR